MTVKTNGTVVQEGEDRKENQIYTGATWTWAEFVERYGDSNERGYSEAAAYIQTLLNPKLK